MKKIKRVVLATGKLISGGLNSYWIGIAKPQARVISTFPGERKHVVSDSSAGRGSLVEVQGSPGAPGRGGARLIDIAELARTERDWARTDNLFMLFKEVVIDIMHSHALDDDRARSAPIRLVMYCPAGSQARRRWRMGDEAAQDAPVPVPRGLRLRE